MVSWEELDMDELGGYEEGEEWEDASSDDDDFYCK